MTASDDNLAANAAGVLVDAEELAVRLTSPSPPVLLDVRWALGLSDGAERFASGHIPGAVYVDLDTELSGEPSPGAGRHPLPPIAALQEAARRWGIRSDSTVVAYDDAGNLAAGRAWWLLRWAGLREVALLDGGLAAWVAAGMSLEPGFVEAAPGDVVLSPGHLGVLDADAAAVLAQSGGVLLDARAGERYRGEVEPIDSRAGHIPGARSAPTSENLDATGAFLDARALTERFRVLGVDGSAPIGVYCGSGVTAAHEIAALAIAGFDAALYPGSWSQWSADSQRAAATGP